MFDPVKNAKVLGIVFLVWGIIQIPVNVFGVGISRLSLPSLIGFLQTIILLVVAFGLFKTKVWAVYAFGILTLLSIVSSLYSFLTTQNVSGSNLVGVAIDIIIFIWFYSAIKRFNR